MNPQSRRDSSVVKCSMREEKSMKRTGRGKRGEKMDSETEMVVVDNYKLHAESLWVCRRFQSENFTLQVSLLLYKKIVKIHHLSASKEMMSSGVARNPVLLSISRSV